MEASYLVQAPERFEYIGKTINKLHWKLLYEFPDFEDVHMCIKQVHTSS